MAPIEILDGDMFVTNWDDADVIYINNVLFPDDMILRKLRMAPAIQSVWHKFIVVDE